MEMFEANMYPSSEKICQLAKSLNITEEYIRRWLRDRRHKKKAEGGLSQSEYCQEGIMIITHVEIVHFQIDFEILISVKLLILRLI